MPYKSDPPISLSLLPTISTQLSHVQLYRSLNVPGTGQAPSHLRVFLGVAVHAWNTFTQIPALVGLPVLTNVLFACYLSKKLYLLDHTMLNYESHPQHACPPFLCLHYSQKLLATGKT